MANSKSSRLPVKVEGNKLPTPQQAEQDRQQKLQASVGFDDVLRYLSLGLSPVAPRLPEQAMQYGSMFGGYPKGYTNRMGSKGSLSYFVLRQVAQRSPLLSAIVSRRLFQTTRHARIASKSKKTEVGMNVVHRRQHDKDFTVPEGFKNLCREAEQMMMKPWRIFWDQGRVFKDVEPNLAGFISKVTEDLLVINRPVVELGLDPLKVPRAFGAIDGANVIPTFSALKYLTSINRDIPKGWEESYGAYSRTMQQLADRYKVDMDDRTEYIYLLGGRPVAGFRSDEIIIGHQFPTSDVRQAGYPPSLAERAIFIILAEIMAMTSNSRYFEFGSMAEVLVTIKGNQNDKHVSDLHHILKGNMSGVSGMYRLPLIATPGGKDDIEVVPIKQNHKDMLFDVYIQKLTNLACAVFSMHPSEINEAARAGDNSGSINQPSQTKQINMAQEQGLESTLEHLKTTIFDPILERIDADLVLEWDYGANEQEQVTVTNLYATFTTVDERRQMMGLDPLGPEKGGDVVDNQFIQQREQRELEQQQLAAQGAQAGAPGGQAGQAGGSPSATDESGGGTGVPGIEEDDEEQVDYGKEKLDDRLKRIAGKSGREASR